MTNHQILLSCHSHMMGDLLASVSLDDGNVVLRAGDEVLERCDVRQGFLPLSWHGLHLPGQPFKRPFSPVFLVILSMALCELRGRHNTPQMRSCISCREDHLVNLWTHAMSTLQCCSHHASSSVVCPSTGAYASSKKSSACWWGALCSVANALRQ